MKKKVLLITGLMVVLILGGCHAKTQDKASIKESSSASVTKTTKKSKVNAPVPSSITTTLDGLKGKFAEDQQTRTNGGELTYSNFYWKGKAWHWALTSVKRGTIANGKVTAISNGKNGNPDSLKLTSSTGDSYSLKLTVVGEYYTVQTSYKDIKGTYIVGDTDGKWTDSAPAKLQASWRSGFEKTEDIVGDQNSDYPYTKVTFSIKPGSLEGGNIEYKRDKQTKVEGSGWGINEGLMSKKVATNTYLLKSYSGDSLFGVYKVQYINSREIQMNFGTVPISLKKVNAGQDYVVPNSGAVDTTNLTKQQVKTWVWSDLMATIYAGKDFKMSDFIFDTRTADDLLYVDVKENHSTARMKATGGDPSVNPTIAHYRINGSGELESDLNGWSVVSDSYSE